MPRRRRLSGRSAAVCGLVLTLASGAGCDDSDLQAGTQTVPFSAQVEATDPPFDTVVEAPTAVQIVDDLYASVLRTLGIVLATEDDRCIRAELIAGVDPDALARLGLDGIVGEQPIPVQNQVFAAFDRCVSPERFAEVLSPVLVIAGAEPEAATCYFESARRMLGFAGMYRYAAGETGELDRDETLVEANADLYDACDIDPERLAPPTTAPQPETSTSPTTSRPATTAPRPPTTPTTLPVLSTTTSTTDQAG